MKYLVLLMAISLLASSMEAQEKSLSSENPSFYFNKVQYYTHNCNDSAISIDSSIYFVRKLIEDPRYIYLLRNLLHDSFAQFFIEREQTYFDNPQQKSEYDKRAERCRTILHKMISDTNQNLVRTARPIFYWTSAQANKNDSKKLATLTRDFINSELVIPDIQLNSIGRYAFLIHKILYPNKELTELADELFNITITKLKAGQIVVDTDTASPSLLRKRTWYRYLYAYSNYIKASQCMDERRLTDAGDFFKIAYEYSPDLTDKNNSSSYFYDMIFLMGEENNAFQDGYLNYLINNGNDKKQTLVTLLSIALTNPSYKKQLTTFYTANFLGEETFSSFWTKAINASLKPAPAYSLKKMDGKLFTINSNNGRWLLVDFWGTWCGPCRKEHPDMQKFYDEIETKYKSKISLLTVACLDKQEAVIAYMKKNKYNFPVAMSDNEIEKIYPVKGYPTKILISPQGKYVIVPFGTDDWIDFVKQYCDL